MKNSQERWKNARETLGSGLLSVILPVFNLGSQIRENLIYVSKQLEEAGLEYELIPVDDGSTDNSADEIRAAAGRIPGRIRPVILEKNAGKGNALRAGFSASIGDFILMLDGDLDIKLSSLSDFFDVFAEKNADIVIGSKRHPQSRVQYPWHRRLASKIYFSIVYLLTGIPLTDTQTGMKLFRRTVLKESLERMLVKAYAFDLELLAIAFERGAKIAEAPVEIEFGQKFGALRVRTIREMMHDTMAIFYRLRLLHYYAKVEVPPPLKKEPLVSVVIACPDGSWMLDECLEALAKQTYRNFEVIILPDGPLSLENTDKRLNTVVIPTGKVRPAEKRNTGIARAQGDIVAFIDDDAYPAPDWLEHAVKYFSNPDIGAVGGPGVTPPGDSFMARAGGRVYENIFVSGNYRYRYVDGKVKKDVDDYPSCNLLVRTSLLREINGFRLDFWPGEDTLLCEDIVFKQKKRIVYDPWVRVFHHRRKLFAPHLRQLGRYAFHRGYFVKHHPATSCRLSYFIPTLFVAGLVAGAGVFAMPYMLPKIIYLSTVGVYCALVMLSSFTLNLPMWFMTFAGVFMSHIWYGVRFLHGLLSRKAPCEYIGQDHPNSVRIQRDKEKK